MPPLCTYRLNWIRRTSWGWWDEWDDTALQTKDSKFKPCRSEAELATSQSRNLPTILNLNEGAGKKHLASLKPKCQSEVCTRDLRLYEQAALTTAPGPPRSVIKIHQALNFSLFIYIIMMFPQLTRDIDQYVDTMLAQLPRRWPKTKTT